MPTCWSQSLCGDCYSIGHPWTPSCISACTNHLGALLMALKIYAPIYSISFLLRRKGKEYFKNRLFQEILQSSLFLSSHGCLFGFYFCLLRKIFGKFYIPSVGLLPGFFSALTSIFIERKSKRGALAIYMLNQTCDTVFNLLKGSGYVDDVEYGEVAIFSITMAVLMYMYSSGLLPDGFVKTILNKLFKRKTDDNNNCNGYFESDFTIIKNSIYLGSKVFCIGFSLHTVYSLLTSLAKIMKKPIIIYKAVLRKENFEFGAWSGSYVFMYDAMSRLLKKYNKFGLHVNAAVAGGVAGVSMLWHRKTSYALWVAIKTVELLYMSGIEKGVVPYVKHFDSILFSCCTAIMFHALILQPLYLKPAYFRFLESLSGNKFIECDREKMDVFGYDSSRINRLPVPNPWIDK